MSDFDELIVLKSHRGFVYQHDTCRVVFAPDLGARVFCELDGIPLHRLKMDNIRNPNQPFNNYGGNNFWPAPEGGMFGFNYQEDQWRVQPAINNEPFILTSNTDSSAKATKETNLENRRQVELDVIMERQLRIVDPVDVLVMLEPISSFAYQVDDTISLANNVSVNDALLACWTLEQFEADDNTISFAKVKSPQHAVNYDFYSPPEGRITYGDKGLFYKTDGKEQGQIGIRKEARAAFIGFYDLERKLICIREIIDPSNGLYFNIADNEQPNGPFSAEDNYSIFNGDEELGFFELETIGNAQVQDHYLRGSHLSSKTSFARFETQDPILKFVQSMK